MDSFFLVICVSLSSLFEWLEFFSNLLKFISRRLGKLQLFLQISNAAKGTISLSFSCLRSNCKWIWRFQSNILKQTTRVNFFEVYLEKQIDRDEVFQLQLRPRLNGVQIHASTAWRPTQNTRVRLSYLSLWSILRIHHSLGGYSHREHCRAPDA